MRFGFVKSALPPGLGRAATVVDRWAAVEFLLLLIAAPLLIFPNRWTPISLVVLPIGWLTRLIRGRPWNHGSVFYLLVVGLMLTTAVGVMVSIDLELSQPKLYGLLLGFFVLCYVAENVRGPTSLAVLATILLAGGVGVALIGLVGTGWIQSKIAILGPLYGVLPRLITSVRSSSGTVTAGFQPNEVAGTIDLLLPVALGLALYSPDRRLRSVEIIAAATMTVTLGLTASRSGLTGALIAGAILVTVRWRRARFVAAAFVLGGVLAISKVGADRAVSWLLAMQATPGVPDSAATRLEIWNRALLMVRDFPFTGIGLNTFPLVVNLLYPLFLSGSNPNVPHAHDLFLQTALDLGLPGLAFFLGLLVVVAWNIRRAWRLTGGWAKGLVVGIAAGLIGHLAFGLTDAVALGAKPGLFLWLMLGVGLALGSMSSVGAEGRSKRPGIRRWAAYVTFSLLCVGSLAMIYTRMHRLF